MMRHRQNLAAGSLLGLLGVALVWVTGAASRQPTEFKAEDEIKSVVVTLEVGGGADLNEAVALDLGLGFPFWLHPVGRQPKEPLPFGAIPQETTARTKIAAGSSATFTFHLDAEPGQDTFRTTSQLLAGVRISDISRIGFSGPGNGDWTLAAYEIKINGSVFLSRSLKETTEAPEAATPKSEEGDRKIDALLSERADLQALVKAKLASEDDLKRLAEVEASLKALQGEKDKVTGGERTGVQARAAQDSARKRLTELDSKIAPLQAELTAGRALVESQLAEEADRKRLVEVETSLAPLQREKVWLEGQLEGKYPWFVEKDFKATWRVQEPIQSAVVTLVTNNHPGADTRNHVYFRTGGHKYLLNSTNQPIRAGALQTFRLDLLAGPLTSADLRGWALGMLGQPQPFSTAPDRWHPSQLLVEIDGKTVYDSAEKSLDRQSLESIRLIPPAHLDRLGKLVVNTPNARETFVWEAGKGTGVDPETGKPLDLPGKEDANYPKPEPGLPDQPGEEQPGIDEVPPVFPGEEFPIPSDSDGTSDGVVPPDGGEPWPDVWPPVWPDGWGPLPVGPPVQISNVRITQGWKTDDAFRVEWTVTGDESQVAYYRVALVQILPDQALPIGASFALSGNLPPGTRSHIGFPMGIAAADRYHLFLAPYVVAMPIDPVMNTPHERLGPARAICPAGTDPALQPSLWSIYQYNDPAAHNVAVASAEPPAPQRGVWPAGRTESYLGIEFESISTGLNIGVRPAVGDTSVSLWLVPSPTTTFTGRYRVVAYVGFLGGANASNTTNVTMSSAITSGGATFGYPAVTASLTTPQGGVDRPMRIIEQVIDSANALGPAPFSFYVKVDFQQGAGDPTHPPALFGVRLIPEVP